MFFLNTHGIWFFIFFVIIFQYFILKNKESAYHSIFAVFSAFVISMILKELFLVPRPFMVSPTTANAGLAKFSSLPSTHAALAFALATTVAIHNKKEGILALIIASLISLGRVAARVHYPLDIAVGILIGVLTAMFFDTLHFGKKRMSSRT